MKKRGIILFISGIIIWCCGLFVLFLGVFNGYDDLHITDSKPIELLLKIGGCIGFFIGLAFMILYIFHAFKESKSAQIEEKDERNIAIRGKAAEVTCFVTTILLLVLEVIFICIDLGIATSLTALVILVHSFLLVFLQIHYSKKM